MQQKNVALQREKNIDASKPRSKKRKKKKGIAFIKEEGGVKPEKVE